MIRMRARDSFYSDDVGQVTGNQEFEVGSDVRAKELESRGLADRISGAKAEGAAPKNKAERPAANKAEASPARKSRASGQKPRNPRKRAS